MIIVTVLRTHAAATVTEVLTAGRVGMEAKFHFSSEWDGLGKTAVFEAGGVIKDVIVDPDGILVPHECMIVGADLRVGVYGYDESGEIVIPTIYALVGQVQRGADPSGDESYPPTPNVGEQAVAAASKALEAAAEAQEVAADIQRRADAGEFDGRDGAQGEKGDKGDKGDPGTGAVELDTTLTQSGKAADAKAVGDALANIGGGKAIIDVSELPTANINEDVLYRLTTGMVVYNGQNGRAFDSTAVYVVDSLPETGEPCDSDSGESTAIYYNTSNGVAYGYIDDRASISLSQPVGWKSASTAFAAMGYEYSGVVTSMNNVERYSAAVLLEHNLYHYKNGWERVAGATPFFDLPNLGLEAIDLAGIADGVSIRVGADTRAIINALARGAVKFGFQIIYNGATLDVEALGSAMYLEAENTYQIHNFSVFADMPMTVTISVDKLYVSVSVAAASSGGGSIELDTTLTQSGKAADAKAVGDALAELEEKIPESGGGVSDYTELTNKPKINGVELSGNKTSADLGIGSPTDEQVAATVEAWLDAHPEATTSVADGSISTAKLADGAVSIDKMADSAFVVRKTTLIQSNGGMPLFAFPLEGITNAELSVKATVTLLSENSVSFSVRPSESDNDTVFGNAAFLQPPSATLTKDNPVRVFEGTYAVTDKPYMVVLIHTGNATCDFYIDFEVTHGETKLNNSRITISWGTGTASEHILEGQERGAVATVATAKKLAAEAAAEAKAYTDESLADYVYEIPDKNVTLAKLADSAFELDRYSVLTLSNGDFAFLSFDISGIADRNGKTAEVEYYYTPLDENFTGLSNRMATGNTTGEYLNVLSKGDTTVVDEENKIYKINATYTIASDTHIYLNLYPQISASAETQVKFFGVTVTVDDKKLEWVEAHRFLGGTVFPIVGVYQEGEYLLKLEHAEQLIAEAIGSVEASVNDAKDEVAQLKALIGDGTNTVVESPLNGKKWGVVGDSITFGTGATDASKTYHGYISAKYLMTISNQGVAGKSVALRPTYNDTLIDNVNALPADCDYVTVFAGTNDYGNSIAIGTFADTTNATFYGAMKLMCEALYARFGGKKFAFFTPTQRSGGNTANSASKTLKDYRDVIIEVCGYYGIPVLDLYAESGINPNLCGDFTGDGLHLNDAGHERISNRIAKFLESL